MQISICRHKCLQGWEIRQVRVDVDFTSLILLHVYSIIKVMCMLYLFLRILQKRELHENMKAHSARISTYRCSILNSMAKVDGPNMFLYIYHQSYVMKQSCKAVYIASSFSSSSSSSSSSPSFISSSPHHLLPSVCHFTNAC